MSAAFRIEPLADHDRATFSCAESALDQYFQKQATQDIRRHIANCFVAVDAPSEQVAGFYTLASGSIFLTELPPEIVGAGLKLVHLGGGHLCGPQPPLGTADVTGPRRIDDRLQRHV